MLKISAVSLGLVAAAVAVAAPGEKYGPGDEGAKSLPNCPVMGEPVNFAISTPTPDGPVFFCCEGCVKKFEADPPKYASATAEQRKALLDRPKAQTTCPVSGKLVNQDVSIKHQGKSVYFCCGGCVSRFRNDPSKYADALANSYTYQTECPVSKKPIDPASFTKLADGRSIYYCCGGCESRLFGDPAKYAKNLADQGFQFNFAKIKKAGEAKHEGHDHPGQHDGHLHHDHDDDH